MAISCPRWSDQLRLDARVLDTHQPVLASIPSETTSRHRYHTRTSRSARMTLGSRLSVWACGVSVRHRAQRKCRVRYRTYARSSTRHNSFYCSCRPCTSLTPTVQLSAPKARRSRGSPRPQAATPAGDCHSNSISEIRPACTARSAQQTANRALWPRIAVATCG